MKKRLQTVYYYLLKFKNKITQGSPVLVLMYHRISNEYDKENKYLTVTVSDFEEQLQYFKKHFQILRLNEDWNNKKPAVVLTFDDGYADNLLNALPLLEKYNIPATIFVCTQNIGTLEEFWWDKLINIYNNLGDEFWYQEETCYKSNKSVQHILSDIYYKSNEDKDLIFNGLIRKNKINYTNRDAFRSLSIQELQQLEQHNLIDIGLHSHEHLPMKFMKFDEQIAVFKQAENELKKVCENYIPYFAIPHGTRNEHTLAALNQTNLEGVLMANNYYTNKVKKNTKIISRILMPSIAGNKVKKYLAKYL
jgi:peptidoglycan/xylan/chitin deacetylase (PgdA/CDA1 family)